MTWILALGLAGLPVYGQTSQPAPAQQPAQAPTAGQAAQAAPPAPKTTKKVWDNDTLSELLQKGEVPSTAPVVVPPSETLAQVEAAAVPPLKQLAPEKDPKVYKDKLDALRKRLADLDAKIQETQGAMSGNENGSNAINVTQPTPILRPQDQLAAYQKERQEVQQQIDDLESEARKNNISPGDIRSNP
jgi:polyhydroxyalkanoate synthesis regulator phasin